MVVAICPAPHLFEQHHASPDLGLAGSRLKKKTAVSRVMLGGNLCHVLFGKGGLSWKRYE